MNIVFDQNLLCKCPLETCFSMIVVRYFSSTTLCSKEKGAEIVQNDLFNVRSYAAEWIYVAMPH